MKKQMFLSDGATPKEVARYDALVAKAHAENEALLAAEDEELGKLFDKHLMVTGAPIDPRKAAIGAMRELRVQFCLSKVA